MCLPRFHDGFASRAVKRIAARQAESRTLAALRDALLPKLMSGDLNMSSTT
jgi:hypothetical protein